MVRGGTEVSVHIWYVARTIWCPDGTAVGKLGPRFKTFHPWEGLRLSGWGIYLEVDRDRQGEIVQDVTSVDTPTESSPDHFLAHLEDLHLTEEGIHEAVQRHGQDWHWDYFLAGEEKP
jgi:hypothetical protein